jgi:hypothetical protein
MAFATTSTVSGVKSRDPDPVTVRGRARSAPAGTKGAGSAGLATLVMAATIRPVPAGVQHLFRRD